MKDNFTNYKNYGLGMTNNLLLSYIIGWGDKGTYASNVAIASHFNVNVRTIQRSLNELEQRGHIKFTNRGKRNRVIYQGHNVPVIKDNMSSTTDNMSSMEDNLSSKGDTESAHNINKINDKITNIINDNIDNEEYILG